MRKSQPAYNRYFYLVEPDKVTQLNLDTFAVRGLEELCFPCRSITIIRLSYLSNIGLSYLSNISLSYLYQLVLLNWVLMCHNTHTFRISIVPQITPQMQKVQFFCVLYDSYVERLQRLSQNHRITESQNEGFTKSRNDELIRVGLGNLIRILQVNVSFRDSVIP